MYRSIIHYKCNVCDKNCITEADIKEHLREAHHYPMNSYCPYCSSIKLISSEDWDTHAYSVLCLDCRAQGPIADSADRAIEMFIRRGDTIDNE